jgi:CheY-like chemotaxis protein
VTNQKLAICLLQKHGHSVVVANDGQEAVDAASREVFDLILMDVQMPVLDGLEATGAIRQNQQAGGIRVPIVALTANALTGDRERCLRAGMDDYITKPLDAKSLFAIIERAVEAGPASGWIDTGVITPNPPASAEQVFDSPATLDQIGDDSELLAQLVSAFLEQLPRLLPPVAEAVRKRDGKAIRNTAHAVCSSVSVLVAPQAQVAARRLELMGLNLELDHIEEAHARMLAETAKLQESLNHWMTNKAP